MEKAIYTQSETVQSGMMRLSLIAAGNLLVILAILLSACLGTNAQAQDTNTTRITLAWDVPKEALGTNASVQIYRSTNVIAALRTWQMITNVPATTNMIQIDVIPGRAFYVATFSNFWGASDFSAVAATPPLLRGDEINLGVSR